MKIINTANNEVIGEILTNHSMSIDESLNFVYDKWTLDEEGQIYEDGEATGVWYDDLEMQY